MATTLMKRLIIGCLIGTTSIVSFASPGLSKEQASCPRFDPAEPQSDSGQSREAPSAKVVRIEDDAIKADPVVIDFEVGTNVWVPQGLTGSRPLVEDTKFFNLQVSSDSRREVTLTTKLMWDSPRQLADLDLFIYDARGREIQRSEKPMGQPQSRELVSVPARSCEGFTVEVRALRTLETSGSLTMWLEG